MKVSIPLLENADRQSQTSGHFGRAKYFAFIDTNDDKTYELEIKSSPFIAGHGPGDLPKFIKDNDANTLIVSNIGARAIDLFEQMGISVLSGATGTIEEVMDLYFNDKLTNQDLGCNHQDRGVNHQRNCH